MASDNRFRGYDKGQGRAVMRARAVRFLAIAVACGRRPRAPCSPSPPTSPGPGYAASLGPLDLAASREGSTVVVDRDGRLLRAFTLPDGRWRLPASDARRRSALSRHAARLRGRALLRASRRRSARAAARGRAMARARPHRLRRLDADDAGRAPARAARANARCRPSSARSRARDEIERAVRQGRACSTAISRSRRSAAISRACAPRRSPISARSRGG